MTTFIFCKSNFHSKYTYIPTFLFFYLSRWNTNRIWPHRPVRAWSVRFPRSAFAKFCSDFRIPVTLSRPPKHAKLWRPWLQKRGFGESWCKRTLPKCRWDFSYCFDNLEGAVKKFWCHFVCRAKKQMDLGKKYLLFIQKGFA